MSINIGNSKIGKIYVGSTAIGKVYKGSELMWESGPSLKLYGMSYESGGNIVHGYLIGSWSTSAVYLAGTFGSAGTNATITSISGTLGVNGSKINIQVGETGGVDIPYVRTYTTNGVKIYLYETSVGGFTMNDHVCVMEKSKVGSTALWATTFGTGTVTGNPSSVTSTTCVCAGTTCNRDSSTDATWYLTGVK